MSAHYDPEKETVTVRWIWNPDEEEEMTMEEFLELAKPENLLARIAEERGDE